MPFVSNIVPLFGSILGCQSIQLRYRLEIASKFGLSTMMWWDCAILSTVLRSKKGAQQACILASFLLWLLDLRWVFWYAYALLDGKPQSN